MDIYALLQSKQHNKHYLKRYHDFILSCSIKNLDLSNDVYKEKHHICPKADDLFPEYKNLKIHEWNKIELTARQHYLAHWMLWKAYPNYESLSVAFFLMSNKKDYNKTENKSSRTYEKLREDYSKFVKKNNKGKGIYCDKNGDIIYCKIDDPRVISGELKSNITGTATYRGKDGIAIRCSTADPRIASGELISTSIGSAVYFDPIISKNIKVSIDDPRVVSGELIHVAKGKANYKIVKTGEVIKCSTNDPRIATGELISVMVGKKATEETLEKLRGRVWSNESRQKLSISKTGDRSHISDKTVYHFKNKNTNEEIFCKRFELENKIGKSIADLFRKMRHPAKSCHGWYLVTE